MSLMFQTIKSNKAKTLIKCFLPPVILRFYHRLMNSSPAYRDYRELPHRNNDYSDVDLIHEIVMKTKKFSLNGQKQHLVQFDDILPMLVLALRGTGVTTNIIDFGGAAGAHYFFAKKYFEIDGKIKKWKIIETPNMVRNVLKTIPSEGQLTFEYLLNDAIVPDQDNLVIANCSVCYVEDPYSILRQMLELGCSKILLTRTPFSEAALQKPVLLQRSRVKDHGIQSIKLPDNNKKMFTPVTVLELNKLVEKLDGVGRIGFYAKQGSDVFRSRHGSYDTYTILIEKSD